MTGYEGIQTGPLGVARPSADWTGPDTVISSAKNKNGPAEAGPLRKKRRPLRAVFPISGSAFVMRDGHDAHCGRFIPVNDRERESVQDESACSVPIRRPALRPLGQIFEGIVNLGKESGTRLIISLPVPSLGLLHFLPCLWMETVGLTCWHLTAGPRGGGALLRTESSELCQSRCPRCGA